jgi:hypothetical protein
MGRPALSDLDALDGEVLPERTVLSTVSSPFHGSAPAATHSSGSGHGTTVVNSCQTTTSYGTPGLLGSLGLGSENPHTTTTCTPSTVVTHG